jgi:hypothetical protein
MKFVKRKEESLGFFTSLSTSLTEGMRIKKEDVEMINLLYDILPSEITKEDVKKLDDVIDFLERSDSKKRKKLYSLFITTIVQYFLGINDELKKIKIYGKTDKGEPYIISIK